MYRYEAKANAKLTEAIQDPGPRARERKMVEPGRARVGPYFSPKFPVSSPARFARRGARPGSTVFPVPVGPGPVLVFPTLILLLRPPYPIT